MVEVERMEWQDSCLGLAEAGEVCAQVITPDWELTLRAEVRGYVLRTDGDASAIRMEEPQ